MRVAIYGAGAMGTVLGAFLTEGGQAVDLISRNKAHVDGLRQNGAVVRCLADGIKKTIKWYLDNREWWEEIISGEYQNYYEKMYGNR